MSDPGPTGTDLFNHRADPARRAAALFNPIVLRCSCGAARQSPPNGCPGWRGQRGLQAQRHDRATGRWQSARSTPRRPGWTIARVTRTCPLPPDRGSSGGPLRDRCQRGGSVRMLTRRLRHAVCCGQDDARPNDGTGAEDALSSLPKMPAPWLPRSTSATTSGHAPAFTGEPPSSACPATAAAKIPPPKTSAQPRLFVLSA